MRMGLMIASIATLALCSAATDPADGGNNVGGNAPSDPANVDSSVETGNERRDSDELAQASGNPADTNSAAPPEQEVKQNVESDIDDNIDEEDLDD